MESTWENTWNLVIAKKNNIKENFIIPTKH